MKYLFFLLISLEAFAVCNSPISRLPETIKPTSARFNGDFDLLHGKLNEVSGDCLNDNSVTVNQLADGIISTDKIVDGSVTAAKIASGVIPSYGKPLRIRAYTASGPWAKLPDVGFIVVQMVGGGGGHSSGGGQSSFGAHCLAGGGGHSAVNGVGGGAAYGDITLVGGSGERQTQVREVSGAVEIWSSYRGDGGHSLLQPFGQGGSYYYRNFNVSENRWGGGSGGYCMKVIPVTSLGDRESVIVGAGGTGPANSNPGRSGLVLIYEYGR